MDYEAIIFDLDGTLINTIEDIADSMNEILKKYNRETYSYTEYKKLVGSGFNNLIKDTFKQDIEDDDLVKIRKELDLEYSKRYLNKSKPYRNITKLVEVLSDNNILLAVNTNKKEEYSIEILAKLFPTINFISIVGQGDRFNIKPNPEGALSIIDIFGKGKDKVLYVGDSDVDMHTGRNAGVKTVGVSWGFRGKEELINAGANYIVNDPFEILDILNIKMVED
ncbi:MAG TPA: HAD family hydrolase [Tissierellaceae bacterium]